MARVPGRTGLIDLFPGAVAAGAALTGRGWRVAVAESCTGGLLAAALTAVPGSSVYVLGGVVAYANPVKVNLLGVDEHVLEARGAVSEEVAAAMAAGVRARLHAEVGVGITGVAGPGADGGKQAGLVFVAVESPVESLVSRLDGDHGREGNRVRAVEEALRLLLEVT